MKLDHWLHLGLSILVLVVGIAVSSGQRDQRLSAVEASYTALAKRFDDNTAAMNELRVEVARLAQKLDDIERSSGETKH